MDRNHNPTHEQLEAQKAHAEKNSNICSILAATIFAPRLPANQKNITKIDATLEKLYEQQLAGQTKLGELKVNLGKLSNKKNKVDPKGLPRTALVAQTKKRMGMLLHQNKQYQKNIDFFVACKMNLENNAMTREMASNIKVLKKEMIKVGAINVEKLQDDVDFIADANHDIQDVNNLVSDTMVNAWDMDMDMDDELEAYLAEDLSDTEGDEVGENEYVKPLVDPLARRNAERERMERAAQELPNIPEAEEDDDVVDPEERTLVGSAAMHDF